MAVSLLAQVSIRVGTPPQLPRLLIQGFPMRKGLGNIGKTEWEVGN